MTNIEALLDEAQRALAQVKAFCEAAPEAMLERYAGKLEEQRKAFHTTMDQILTSPTPQKGMLDFLEHTARKRRDESWRALRQCTCTSSNLGI